jgi:hypothetical protein
MPCRLHFPSPPRAPSAAPFSPLCTLHLVPVRRPGHCIQLRGAVGGGVHPRVRAHRRLLRARNAGGVPPGANGGGVQPGQDALVAVLPARAGGGHRPQLWAAVHAPQRAGGRPGGGPVVRRGGGRLRRAVPHQCQRAKGGRQVPRDLRQRAVRGCQQGRVPHHGGGRRAVRRAALLRVQLPRRHPQRAVPVRRAAAAVHPGVVPQPDPGAAAPRLRCQQQRGGDGGGAVHGAGVWPAPTPPAAPPPLSSAKCVWQCVWPRCGVCTWRARVACGPRAPTGRVSCTPHPL